MLKNISQLTYGENICIGVETPVSLLQLSAVLDEGKVKTVLAFYSAPECVLAGELGHTATNKVLDKWLSKTEQICNLFSRHRKKIKLFNNQLANFHVDALKKEFANYDIELTSEIEYPEVHDIRHLAASQMLYQVKAAQSMKYRLQAVSIPMSEEQELLIEASAIINVEKEKHTSLMNTTRNQINALNLAAIEITDNKSQLGNAESLLEHLKSERKEEQNAVEELNKINNEKLKEKDKALDIVRSELNKTVCEKEKDAIEQSNRLNDVRKRLEEETAKTNAFEDELQRSLESQASLTEKASQQQNIITELNDKAANTVENFKRELAATVNEKEHNTKEYHSQLDEVRQQLEHETAKADAVKDELQRAFVYQSSLTEQNQILMEKVSQQQKLIAELNDKAAKAIGKLTSTQIGLKAEKKLIAEKLNFKTEELKRLALHARDTVIENDDLIEQLFLNQLFFESSHIKLTDEISNKNALIAKTKNENTHLMEDCLKRDEIINGMEGDVSLLQKQLSDTRSKEVKLELLIEQKAKLYERETTIEKKKYEREVKKSNKKIDELNSNILGLLYQKNTIVHELEEIKSSTYWKSYAPFRKVGKLFNQKESSKQQLKSDCALVMTSKYFDIEWYLKTYRDVAAADINAAEHYILFGAKEGRQPSPAFDGLWYTTKYADVAASGINPLLHFLKFGQAEGRQASPKFLENNNRKD
jgi:predicted  nucleic acid-binding Zn-ribbon protein